MWAQAGECDKNPVYMLRECMVSCNQCPAWQLPDENSTDVTHHNSTAARVCVDTEDRCGMWAAAGECDKNPIYMLRECMISCNQCTPKGSDGGNGGSSGSRGGDAGGANVRSMPNPNSNGNMTVLPDGIVRKHATGAPSSPAWGRVAVADVRGSRAPSAPAWSMLNETMQRDLARDLMVGPASAATAPATPPKAGLAAATMAGSTVMGGGAGSTLASRDSLEGNAAGRSKPKPVGDKWRLRPSPHPL